MPRCGLRGVFVCVVSLLTWCICLHGVSSPPSIPRGSKGKGVKFVAARGVFPGPPRGPRPNPPPLTMWCISVPAEGTSAPFPPNISWCISGRPLQLPPRVCLLHPPFHPSPLPHFTLHPVSASRFKCGTSLLRITLERARGRGRADWYLNWAKGIISTLLSHWL